MNPQAPLDIHQIVYASQLKKEFPQTEIMTILEKARTTNLRIGITGYLFWRSGYIIQLLEGEKIYAKFIFHKIMNDPRHHHITILSEGPARSRLFGAWQMAYKDISGDDSALISAMADVMELKRKLSGFELLNLLAQFKAG